MIRTSKKIEHLIKQGYDFIVTIIDNKTRMRIYESLAVKKTKLPILIHTTAVIDETVSIGFGTAVMADEVINSATNIGNDY